METTNPQKENTEPVFCVHNSNSNFPDKISSYPAIHLSRYEFGHVVKFQLNGVVCGAVL